jgi:hypothetical protein
MRRWVLSSVLTAAALAAGLGFGVEQARAASAPDYVLYGTIGANGASYQNGAIYCQIPTGAGGLPAFGSSSAYRRTSAGVYLEFAQAVEYYNHTGGNGATDTDFGGWGLLTFTSSNAGTITLDKPAWTETAGGSWRPDPTLSVSFEDYFENFNSSTGLLNVTFKMKFSNCTFPINAVFHDFG